MEESSRRSAERSGIVLKKRSSSGCLIVRKKGGDGVGGVGSSRRKRPRLVTSDSGSSDELSLARPRRVPVGAETIRVCNGLTGPRKRVSEVSVGVGRNGEANRMRSRLDVFEFDEYDGIDGEGMGGRRFDDGGVESSGRRFLGSPPIARSGGNRDFASSSSRQTVVERRKNVYIDETSSFGREDGVGKNRFQVKREGGRIPIQMLREKYGGRPDEAIRVQGKNGVLKVLVNPKKKVGGPVRNLDQWDERRKVSVGEGRKGISEDTTHNVISRPTAFAEIRRHEMRNPTMKIEKNKLNVQKPVSSKINKPDDWESGHSDISPTPSRRNADIRESVTRVREKQESPQSKIGHDREKSPHLKIGRRKGKPRQAKMIREKEKSSQSKMVARAKSPETPVPDGPKEGKVKRGSGTEKQKLRERIREMLLNAGWTIDYRPRRNRDYLDAVYINPTGTAYWSIIKAYDALQKQLKDDSDEGKASGERSAFLISDETLGQLTRKTQKKMEKEMKMKEREGTGSANARQAAIKRNSKPKNEEDSMDSDSEEEKLSSFIKQGGKSSKKGAVHHMHSSIEKGTSDSNFHQVHGRKGRKLGRCTLLVRSSDKGLNSESDGFIPYTGKRTLLSWLIDSGVVELSQKVQYMNRRKTRVLLEGWVTRDGIHCGCCSKILPLSKFEIHAGSKLRQPFQNIHLDSGVSLLQCQIDAWNKQQESVRGGFHSVDTDGDDPNDDTCGLCGDGGDLICCDGCPSTFHQSCLNIQKLPPGDWHCPNCTCKYCGVASECTSHVDNTTVSEIFACNLCEKKYHKSCLEETDGFPLDSDSTGHSFCSQKCGELFEHLQKYLGVKQEIEGGFSWSLIHRTEADSDMPLRGLHQRVECNSKLAVALTIMDECFLPIVDRRSGINMIHNVLYSCGSNFNRINYSGFYTAILERGDEIISAASLRFHGTQLAEMPFIGTRHIYRRQGMCRRLFSAIESALHSLKVEMLIIPAISELMHTWTVTFGFSPLKESLKQYMRSLNMLVFPGLDMLQKLLLGQDTARGSRDAKPMELEMDRQVTTPEPDDICQHDNPGEHSGKEGDDIMDCDPKSQDVSLGDASTGNGSSHDASDDMELQVSSERLKDSDPDLADKSAESDVDHICSAPSNAEVEASKVEDKSMPVLPFQVGVQSTTEDGYTDDSPEAEAGVACKNFASNSEVKHVKILEGINGTPDAASICDSFAINRSQMCPLLSDVSHNKSRMDDKSISDSCVAGDFHNSGCLTNANEEKRDISAVNATEGADGKSRDAPSIHQSEENLILVNSNADDQISYGKENVIEFNSHEDVLSHADVEVENKSLLSFPSEGESLNETHWDSCSGNSRYDNADADVKVTLVEPIATSEEKQETIEIWEEENAEDAPVSTVVSIQASEEAEDFRKDLTVEESCQDASVSDGNSVQINFEPSCPTTVGDENKSVETI
ncbi:uncharacterized protein LOC115744818 isoform X1 [Rhodamnia argentea]|uniref:Uncharacterized protein LOC115744818 isoform X1 n=1 Tax=Rhodamnia argentea TaxID=178133 RepID=A0A8B8PNV9_9MYRT|nr:uncharacterized protein LOC115744818 isoform X1 [Rhodamnia argentea]